MRVHKTAEAGHLKINDILQLNETFTKADHRTFDDQFEEWDQDIQQAVAYVENAFKRSWNGDAAWQPWLLAALLKHKKQLLDADHVNASTLYDEWLLPLYDELEADRPPTSRRSNFIGGRLGNMFNNKGPFVMGGTNYHNTHGRLNRLGDMKRCGVL